MITQLQKCKANKAPYLFKAIAVKKALNAVAALDSLAIHRCFLRRALGSGKLRIDVLIFDELGSSKERVTFFKHLMLVKNVNNCF